MTDIVSLFGTCPACNGDQAVCTVCSKGMTSCVCKGDHYAVTCGLCDGQGVAETGDEEEIE